MKQNPTPGGHESKASDGSLPAHGMKHEKGKGPPGAGEVPVEVPNPYPGQGEGKGGGY